MKTKNDPDATHALSNLRKLLKPGATVYTILRNCSASGMTRHIDMFIMKKNQPQRITWSAAKAMGYRINDKDGGIVTQGCGMDMGFHLVYSLGRTLFPKGFQLAKNQSGRNGDTSGRDNDGGYALNQRWL